MGAKSNPIDNQVVSNYSDVLIKLETNTNDILENRKRLRSEPEDNSRNGKGALAGAPNLKLI